MTSTVYIPAQGNYQTAEQPRRIPLKTTESYATITAAGYLNSLPNPKQYLASDVIEAYYGAGLHGSFSLSIDSSGIITMSPISNPGEVSLEGAATTGNLAMFVNEEGDVEDSEIAAEDVLTVDTDVTDYQQIVGINEILIASVGTWTRTRVAQANYVLRHTDADDTSVIGIDITPAIRAAAGRGFKLASLDVVYSIGTLALDAHSLTLDKVAYANNVAVAVTSVPITGTLATATQAQPYLTNVTVDTPAFDVTANSKYVAELTVNAAATSVYDFYGLNLHFTKSAA